MLKFCIQHYTAGAMRLRWSTLRPSSPGPSSPPYYQAFYLQQFLDCVTATTEVKVRFGVLLKDSAQPVLQRAFRGALWAESWAILPWMSGSG